MHRLATLFTNITNRHCLSQYVFVKAVIIVRHIKVPFGFNCAPFCNEHIKVSDTI